MGRLQIYLAALVGLPLWDWCYSITVHAYGKPCLLQVNGCQAVRRTVLRYRYRGLLMVSLAHRQARDLGVELSPSAILAGLLAALLLEFAVTPHIVAHGRTEALARAGSALYLVQCQCAGKVLWGS
jgi:hypothetical protein